MMKIRVNGREHQTSIDPDTPLLYFLRNNLELNAAKFGCGLGQCSACLVLIDGAPMPSCITPLSSLGDAQVITVEGLASRDDPGPVQRAFVEEEAAQCGYCTAGMIVRAHALLDETPDPTDAQIREAMQPNLCRCGVHMRIMKAVRLAARLRKRQPAAQARKIP